MSSTTFETSLCSQTMRDVAVVVGEFDRVDVCAHQSGKR